ncbi:MAG: sugar phosphate isomerase/epimerase family protein [Candidatus Bathyarchaeia archaeon]
MRFLMFTKMLKNKGNLSLPEAGDYIARMGFDGADLTVREGGYVPPEESAKKLPEAIEILRSKGLEVPMITTNITDARRDRAEEILKTASECGVKYVKLGYWRYKGFGKITECIEEAKAQIRELYMLSKEYGITATIHTHAGPYLSADPGLLFMLLRDYEPDWMGAYIDPGHMFAETGPYGWEMAIDLLAPYIRLVAAKNYRWIRSLEGEGEKPEGEGEGEGEGEEKKKRVRRWEIRMMPLREEIVPWPEVFGRLKAIGFDGCVSLHSEYEHLSFQDLIRQTEDDLMYLRQIALRVLP